MAHGNFSDGVFFMLLAIIIQLLGFPDTLFQDLGPLRAQFETRSADMDLIIKFGGGLLLMIAMTFSGVTWNPKNGKMAGLGGMVAAIIIAVSTLVADSAFVPQLFYVYAAVIFIGALYIFKFPQNPLPPPHPEAKDNHGNVSDKIALPLIVASLLCLFYPEHMFQDIGPLNAQFSAHSADLSAMIRFVSSLMLMIALILSGVKWNPINGKMAGMGGFIASCYTAFSTFKASSGPCLFYIYAILIFLGALHIFAFPANPLPPKADPSAADKPIE